MVRSRFSINDVRFFATSIVLVIFLLFQFLFRATFWGGGLCTMNLTDPTKPPPPDSYPLYTRTTFGWPLGFIAVSEEGCFDERKSKVDWNIPFLLIDALAAGGIVALPYGIPWLWRRSRHRKNICPSGKP